MVINNGTLFQWGTAVWSNAPSNYTLPTSYTNSGFSVLGTIRVSGDPNNGNQTIMIAPVSVNQIRGYMDWVNNAARLGCSWATFGF